jgi:hypothetical protein
MKLILIPFALALASCSGLGGIESPGPTPAQAVADKVVVTGARGLILANLAYQTVGTAAAIGIEQGAITGGTKDQVKAVSQEVVEALVKGEQGVRSADKAASAAAAMASIDKLCGLHPTLKRACEATRQGEN